MKYLSVCSGIEAATVAWHPLGWEPVAFSEIEPFPCKVLAHHYPTVSNWGDMTKFKEWPDAEFDLLVGGTPCQSFSVAGLRKGLDDPRGNLMLTYLAIADKDRPKYIVWENVPGVLSSNGGRDFGTFLGALGKLGYGYAYRVLDAQYVRTNGFPYAVPQRRRRVFVVGCLGDWGRAAAILFDSESVCGNPPPRREAGKGVAFGAERSTYPCGGIGSYISVDETSPLFRTGADLGPGCETIIMSHGQANAEISVGFAPTLNCNHEQPIAFMGRGAGTDALSGVSPTMRSLCCGADGHQSGAAGLAVAYRTNSAGKIGPQDGIAAALNTQTDPCTQFVAFDMRGRDGGSQLEGPHDTANIRAASGGSSRSYVQPFMQVRRLTPRECERLQGFPDDYTDIPGASDTARYKALGNSMACNVMQLIGQRIAMTEPNT